MASRTVRLELDSASDALERGLLLDLSERVFLLIPLTWFAVRVALSLKAEPANIMLMISETMPALMLIMRKRGATSASGGAWLAAIIGTFTPLMTTVGGVQLVTVTIGAGMMFVGLTTNVVAKICLNRSFGVVAANRGVKRSGPYRIVRHPMYLGYAITLGGFLLTHFCLINGIVCIVTWSAFAFRIRAEEQILNRDEAYRNYALSVPYRVIPGII